MLTQNQVSLIVVCIIFGALGYFVYRQTQINREQQQAHIQALTYADRNAHPESPIPHSQTTLPAPGYTANLKAPPYNQPGYAPPPESEAKCRVTLSMKERKGIVPNECPPGQERVGFICYVACPDGMKAHPDFPNQCQRCKDFSDACDFMDMIMQKRQATGPATGCPPGYDRYNGLCYEPCPAGRVPNGNLCLECGE